MARVMPVISSEELTWKWLRFGWAYRGIGDRPQEQQNWYASRVKYEMGLIIDKDFCDFFLATSDMVRWAKDEGIPVGPGRGSVAASVVSWLLRITEVDPWRYPQLLFERFIDVTRTDPPDIDLDFADDRRYEVRDRMALKYGSDRVGTVASYTRYRAKNSLQDVAKVNNVPYAAKEVVSNLIVERSGGDSRFDSGLEDTVAMFPNAKAIFDQYPVLWKACKLEGNVRGMGIHAAGLIVANSPLTDVCAVYERDGRQVLSIDKYDVDYAGMLKMDNLGLTTMGVISNCLKMIGLTLEDLYAIPDDDPEALAVFKRGDVTGVFQFEGRATRLVNRDVSPDNFGEVIDINALSRPGPLFSGTTAEYCDVKFGRREAERYGELTDEITKYTRGQFIYQEQILRTVREVGGFDWTNANEIRRIIAKKIGEAAFNVSMGTFVDGASRLHGMKEETARRIWKRLVTSGTYAFVYAHSVSYSILSLWCAWLKAHYPVEFYACSLAKTDDKEVQFKLMQDAMAHDIKISPPSLAASGRTWQPLPAEKRLVAGWRQIPGIGEKMADLIETSRESGMSFSDWDDLQNIKGIGPKKVQNLREFATMHDPFGLERTERILTRTGKWLKTQRAVPRPTHDGAEIAAIYIEQTYGANSKKNYGKGPKVIYMGMVKEINYQDAVENRRSRTGEEAKDILKTLKRPDLLAYCSVRCYDTTEEEIYLRINRFKFPQLKRILEGIAINHDVVVCVGNRIAGFGTPVMVDNLFCIDPD
jgi:DNA polymerase-3 subunit alpha